MIRQGRNWCCFAYFCSNLLFFWLILFSAWAGSPTSMSAFESHCQHLADNSPEKFVLSGNYWSTKRYFHYVIGEKDQG